jgi:hypothetical protein
MPRFFVKRSALALITGTDDKIVKFAAAYFLNELRHRKRKGLAARSDSCRFKGGHPVHGPPLKLTSLAISTSSTLRNRRSDSSWYFLPVLAISTSNTMRRAASLRK